MIQHFQPHWPQCIFKIFGLIFFCVYVCLAWISVCSQCPFLLPTEVRRGCFIISHQVNAGNWTWVLYKNQKKSLKPSLCPHQYILKPWQYTTGFRLHLLETASKPWVTTILPNTLQGKENKLGPYMWGWWIGIQIRDSKIKGKITFK